MANKFSAGLTLNSYTPVTPVGPSAPYAGAPSDYDAADESSSKKGKGIILGGLDENMIKWLYEKGLKSDVLAFLTEMDYAITNAYDPITGKPNLAMYKMLLPRLAQLDQEKHEFYQALDKMRKADSIDEIAVNSRGEVYVADEEQGIITKSIRDIQPGERLVTNGEIAHLRALNPTAAFSYDLTLTIANGTSMLEINKYIMDNISKLGKTTTGDSKFIGESGQEVPGILALKELAKSGNLLKVDINQSSQAREAYAALNYLIGTLPTNMSRVLQAKAMINDTTVEKLVATFINSTLDTTNKVDYEVMKSPSESDGKGTKVTSGIMYQTGQGGIDMPISIIPGRDKGTNKASVRMTIEGVKFPQLLDSNDNVVGDGSLEKILDSGLGAQVDTSNGIYIGDQWVPESQFSLVLVNTKNVYRAWMPFTTDQHGVMHPDLNLIDEFVILQEGLKKLKTKEEKISYIQRSEFAEYFEGLDKNGQVLWNLKKFAPFMLLDVYADADDALFSDDKDPDAVLSESSRFVTNVESMGITQDLMKLRMQELLGSNYKNEGDVYAGIAYIPLSGNTAYSMVSTGESPKYYDSKEVTHQDDIRKLTRNSNTYNNVGNMGSNLISNK